MKHPLLALLLFIFLSGITQAQDIITKRTGEKLEAKVLEISSTEVKYKRFGNLEGPTYVVPKAEIAVIQYENKTTEAFDLPETGPAQATASVGKQDYVRTASEPAASSASAVQQYNRGQIDAETFYEGYKTASTSVLVVSLISPLAGLVPAIGTSSTPPKTHNLDVPNHQLLNNPDYAAGYRKKARKIKSGKVWTNWAIGLGANLVAVFLIANGQ